MARVALLGSALSILCLLLPGCATETAEVARKGKVYAVTADKTPFYRYGPQQGSGPDQELTRNTLVTLIRPSFGYSKVQLEAGGEGYVASEDIRPAPPTLLAALNPPERDSAFEEEEYSIDANDPRVTPPETELPGPDLPPIEDDSTGDSDESAEPPPAQ